MQDIAAWLSSAGIAENGFEMNVVSELTDEFGKAGRLARASPKDPESDRRCAHYGFSCALLLGVSLWQLVMPPIGQTIFKIGLALGSLGLFC